MQWKGDPVLLEMWQMLERSIRARVHGTRGKMVGGFMGEVGEARINHQVVSSLCRPSRSAQLGTQPHQAMAAVIHQLVNPAAGAPPPDPEILELARNLNKQLSARCPTERKQRKLQSVTSKLDHHRTLLAKA